MLTIKLPVVGGTEEFPSPRTEAVRETRTAVHAYGARRRARRRRSAVGEGALARGGDRLGRDHRLPPAPLVLGLRRRRGDGHRAARHGPRLAEFAGADPQDGRGSQARPRRRCRLGRRDGSPAFRKEPLRAGNHRGLRSAVRRDREAGRQDHPHGEPRARRGGEVARGLRARLRPHPRAGEGAGDHPLAGRDVRPGARGVLGQHGSLRGDGDVPFDSEEVFLEGRRNQDFAARQGQGDRHAPHACPRACACTRETISTSRS